MSVAQACARDSGPGGCDLTWSAVLADRSLCTANTIQSRKNLVCNAGGWHVLDIFRQGWQDSFYYDGTTGALVAILGVGIKKARSVRRGPDERFRCYVGAAQRQSCTSSVHG